MVKAEYIKLIQRFLTVMIFLCLTVSRYTQRISTGLLESSVLYICADSTISAMGANDQGQLGDGTTINRTFPIKVKGLQHVGVLPASVSCTAK